MKVWIIEDEKALSKDLSDKLIRLRPDITIEGVSTGIDDSVAAINSHRDLDIIFADIKIDDGVSFSVFDAVETEAMVVFTTAYDEYALKAFDYNCADYLLKPIREEALEKALEKCEKHLSRVTGQQIRTMSEDIVRNEVKYRKRLFLDYGTGTLICPVTRLAYILTESGYTRVFLDDGTFGSTDQSLNDFVDSLDPTLFCRVSRQAIINIDYAEIITPGPSRDFTVHLRAPFKDTVFIMTPEKTKHLRQLLSE